MFNYVTGNLSIHAMANYRQLVIRFLTGAWCLSCFVLITAYSSVLVSFLTAPDHTYAPLVKSVNDLLNKTDVRVTVNKELMTDILLKVFSPSLLHSSIF